MKRLSSWGGNQGFGNHSGPWEDELSDLNVHVYFTHSKFATGDLPGAWGFCICLKLFLTLQGSDDLKPEKWPQSGMR